MQPTDNTRDARLQVQVECYAGYRGEETPRVFTHGARRHGIAEVLDRWLDPTHRYFKVRAVDGGIYILRHDTASDRWDLVVYDSGTREDTRLSST